MMQNDAMSPKLKFSALRVTYAQKSVKYSSLFADFASGDGTEAVATDTDDDGERKLCDARRHDPGVAVTV